MKSFSMLLERLALHLFDIGAIKFGAFKLKLHEKYPEAPLSPIYVDLGILRSHPEVMDEAVEAYMQELERIDPTVDLIADIPTAATPIVSILMSKTRIPMITPKKLKTHGIASKIEGKFQAGQRVFLIDDLITKAGSKLEAAETLEDSGLLVENILVLVDREQGGVEILKKHDYNLYAIFKITDLLHLYLEKEKISQEEYNETIAYLKEN